jgi:hypothetical protein
VGKGRIIKKGLSPKSLSISLYKGDDPLKLTCCSPLKGDEGDFRESNAPAGGDS